MTLRELAEKIEGHVFTEAMRWKEQGAWKTLFIQDLIESALLEVQQAEQSIFERTRERAANMAKEHGPCAEHGDTAGEYIAIQIKRLRLEDL